MKNKEAIQYASQCQLEADRMAFKIVSMQNAMKLQSMCDFNLFWLYDVSPGTLLHIKTIDFLSENIDKFKRKISVGEIIKYDWILTKNKINDFDEFKNKLHQ